MKSIRGTLLRLAGALAAAAEFSASAGAAAHKTKYPPCTKRALAAGLKRGGAKQPQGRITGGFGCAKGWAYSNIAVGHGAGGFDAIALFKAKNGKWNTASRAKYCPHKSSLPRKVYNGACLAD